MPSHQSRRSSVLLAATATAGLFAVIATGAIAAEVNKNDVKAEAAPAAATESGMKVYIDPKTGAFREPTMEERQAEAAQSNKTGTSAKGKTDAPQIPVVRGKNGTLIAQDREGLLAEYVTVEIGKDGAQHFRCSHGLDQHQPAAQASSQRLEEK